MHIKYTLLLFPQCCEGIYDVDVVNPNVLAEAALV